MNTLLATDNFIVYHAAHYCNHIYRRYYLRPPTVYGTQVDYRIICDRNQCADSKLLYNTYICSAIMIG